MNNIKARVEFYEALNQWQEKWEARVTTVNGEPVNLSPVAFNSFCFEKAKELGLEEWDMNRVISAWACTLDKEPPTYLLKN